MRTCSNKTDSAAGTAKSARDRRTQAILPLKGKVINVLKSELSKVLANQEIKTLIHAIGLQINGNKIVVDFSKLRYDKIVLLADADSDGLHITILLLTFFWTFARELILNGYIYLAMPPLYKVTKGKDNVYLLNDEALQEYKNKYPNNNLIVSRFKGLGEMSVEQLSETVMDKTQRTLKQITVSDVEALDVIINELMGETTAKRKEYITKNI